MVFTRMLQYRSSLDLIGLSKLSLYGSPNMESEASLVIIASIESMIFILEGPKFAMVMLLLDHSLQIISC